MKQDAIFLLSKKSVLFHYSQVKEISNFVYFSFKTNPDVAAVLEKNTDCNFSVHFIKSVEKINDKKRILFFLQAPTHDELDSLFKYKIDKFVVDNEADLDFLLSYIESKNIKITLFLRMRLKEHTIQTGKHFVYGLFSETVNRLLPILRKNKNIENLGIHFHRKTQNVSEWGLKEEIIDSIKKENLKNIDLINIGGGLPSVYKNYGLELIDNIFLKIKELKEFLNKNNIKMIIEPGRFIAAPSVKLNAKIMRFYNNTIIINCSVFNSAMDTFIANIRLLVEGELKTGKSYTIKGCTPDSMDIFRYKVYLNEPKIGDNITFLNAGAYNFSCDFCNLPKLETLLID